VSLKSVTTDYFYKAVKTAVNTVVRHKYEVEGKEQIPKEESFILWAYHRSGMDIIEDGNLTSRRISFITKSEYFDLSFNPLKLVFALALRAGGQIRFDRKGRNSDEVYSGLERAVREKAGVVIYPSGTRNYLDFVGKASGLVTNLADYVIKLSESHGPIHFITVGRTVREVNGREEITVICSEAAIADKGNVFLRDTEAQIGFDAAFPEGRGKGLEFLVNGYIIPRIAALNGMEFKPDLNFYRMNEIARRRSPAGNNRK